VLKPFLERIRAGEVLLADGALGTMLMERGLRSGGCPDEFVLSHLDVLQEIARRYRAAGAEIMTTDTFGASPLKLASYGLADKTGEINRRAVELMRAVARDAAYVFADIGPSGRIVKPYGDTEPEKVRASYEQQMAVLADAGIDAFSLETMIDLAEAIIAVKAAKAVAPAIPVVAMMTFEHRRKGFFTVMGSSISQVAAGLAEAGADVVGSNCGNGIEPMIEIAREFRKATSLPTSFRANAGLPQIVGAETHYPETPEFTASRLPELLDAGVSPIPRSTGGQPPMAALDAGASNACNPNGGNPACPQRGDRKSDAGSGRFPSSGAEAPRMRGLGAGGVSIVGGCCGTTPDHIRAFRQVLDQRTRR
jgi:5-methyltetrahydrofolate--homocysteine methyltransferase